MHSFNAVYARMLFAAGVRTQTELAKLIGIRQGSISDAKRRGTIPMNWCVRLFDVCGVNVDWQRTGEGPVYDERKLEKMRDPDSSLADEVFPEIAYCLRETPESSLELSWPSALPVYSVICNEDGQFSQISEHFFPEEFARFGIEVFRLIDGAMAPALNKGALVAVDRLARPEDGEIAAFLDGGQLIFRRLSRTDGGYELAMDSGEGGIELRFVSDADSEGLFYGKVVWAIQPL